MRLQIYAPHRVPVTLGRSWSLVPSRRLRCFHNFSLGQLTSAVRAANPRDFKSNAYQVLTTCEKSPGN